MSKLTQEQKDELIEAIKFRANVYKQQIKTGVIEEWQMCPLCVGRICNKCPADKEINGIESLCISYLSVAQKNIGHPKKVLKWIQKTLYRVKRWKVVE